MLGKKEISLLMSVEMQFGLIRDCAWNLLLSPLPAIYYAAAAKCQSCSKKFWWEIENLAHVNATEITSPPSTGTSSKKSLLESWRHMSSELELSLECIQHPKKICLWGVESKSEEMKKVNYLEWNSW